MDSLWEEHFESNSVKAYLVGAPLGLNQCIGTAALFSFHLVPPTNVEAKIHRRPEEQNINSSVFILL